MNNIEIFSGLARFEGPNTISVNRDLELTADKIIIATGSKPLIPNIPGKEFLCTSDDFFYMDDRIDRILIVGNGYIAGELTGLFSTLGIETTVAIRETKFLRSFDSDLTNILEEHMRKSNVRFLTKIELIEVKKTPTDFQAIFNDGQSMNFDKIICAIGRVANVDKLNLEAAGIELNERGFIKTDEFETTSVQNIFAIGDVTGKKQQTPVAVAAGRKLSDRLFGNKPNSKLDYNLIPTVMFSSLPLGTIGLTEKEARQKYGNDIKIYQKKFTNLFFEMGSYKEPTLFKMITLGHDEKIIGLHAIGRGVDEMMQGFAVSMKMGATKEDFDETVAIHPSASEEMVLLT